MGWVQSGFMILGSGWVGGIGSGVKVGLGFRVLGFGSRLGLGLKI